MVKVREVKINCNPLEVYNVFKDKINTILLDSSKEDKVLSKFSFIGINPFMIFESKGQEAFINKVKVQGDPFIVLESLIEKYKCDNNNYNNIPLISGAIGYISYDTGRILERLPDTSDEDFNISDMKFIFYRNIIVFDLENNKQYITSITDYGYNEELDCLEEKIGLATIIKEKNFESVNSSFKSNFEKEDYKNTITKLKNYIVNGDVYIANMTQRFYTENQEESFEIYKKLRTINKAPFSAYMNFEDFQVISSSPERFIEINKGKVVTRPIKGTRPRGQNEEEDIKNSLELINSEKDRAELLMVVDLERNDLSKVCKPHSVKVTELFKLEKYATIFHLVSTVEGILKDDVSAVKCIRECFPGGSITGTPKIRAMEIIEELEGLKRNLYTGSIGYFDFRGNADFNIAIRTIIKKENKAYFGVGGGITYDSIEEDEYNETLDKARALMRVL
ncbi:MAG: aminodeoxychorismate synthase component I [Clostridium sp.]|uniref:aminodeoxychorismate synthase component I n=1 Tax=Clostridium sp. TaxID=1506 RepID=UPI001ED69675|nr:aminodeoxychorismate synthase component I [Clostridium sp.]MBS5886516.1 aminodeoxychorismate synthase component I [Clostridium sp.]MDU7150241.1 aminodeoxychorismate synthase component I [Clostridium sp.]MDU7243451.1 aminodeoxychorismate synthase component I [Clostridium sp.]